MNLSIICSSAVVRPGGTIEIAKTRHSVARIVLIIPRVIIPRAIIPRSIIIIIPRTIHSYSLRFFLIFLR